MENPLLPPDGGVVAVTRIEFELLEGGGCRCTLWSDEHRIRSIAVQPGREPEICESTRILLQVMRGLNSRPRPATRPRSLRRNG